MRERPAASVTRTSWPVGVEGAVDDASQRILGAHQQAAMVEVVMGRVGQRVGGGDAPGGVVAEGGALGRAAAAGFLGETTEGVVGIVALGAVGVEDVRQGVRCRSRREEAQIVGVGRGLVAVVAGGLQMLAAAIVGEAGLPAHANR